MKIFILIASLWVLTAVFLIYAAIILIRLSHKIESMFKEDNESEMPEDALQKEFGLLREN